MIRRKTCGARVFGDIRQPQSLSFVKNDAENAVADRRRSDRRASFIADARRDERFDPSVVADNGQSAILRADEIARLVNHFFQNGVERKRRGDIQSRTMQREQLAVLPLDLLVHAAHGAHHDHAENCEGDYHHSVEQQPCREVDSSDHVESDRFQNRDDRQRGSNGEPSQSFEIHIQPGVSHLRLCTRRKREVQAEVDRCGVTHWSPPE